MDTCITTELNPNVPFLYSDEVLRGSVPGILPVYNVVEHVSGLLHALPDLGEVLVHVVERRLHHVLARTKDPHQRPAPKTRSFLCATRTLINQCFAVQLLWAASRLLPRRPLTGQACLGIKRLVRLSFGFESVLPGQHICELWVYCVFVWRF